MKYVMGLWILALSSLTGYGFWVTMNRGLIEPADEERISIREGTATGGAPRRSYFFSDHYRRSPTGGGPGHGK
jgi:hypothetical protein